MSVVERTERGWAGHFICAYRCYFRRNTLLECGGVRVVVSTVGNMNDPAEGAGWGEIGCHRYVETMAFYAELEDGYWGANVNRQIVFESPWAISAPDSHDTLKDEMHEAVVAELSTKMGRGLLLGEHELPG